MLLFTFLLIPTISAALRQTIGDYSITMEDNILTNIQKINPHKISRILNLSGLHISEIKKEAFNNVMDIETLDLSGNNISTLDDRVFSQLKKLRYLLLVNNGLTDVYRAFEGLEHLELLDISNNYIESLNKGDFFGIPKSAVIKASGNNIRTMSRGLFEEVNENMFAILCQHENIVSSLKVWKDSERIERGCRKVRVAAVRTTWMTVFLNELNISGFAEGWYRLHNMDIEGLDLSGNNIVDITSELCNGLPRRLKYINLSKNKIQKVKKGIIVLKNLAWLNLTDNLINKIEYNAFKDTRLNRIILNNNRLKKTNFVATLPHDHLLHLKLRNNGIRKISAGSFSKLSKLTILDLAWNKIKEVTDEHLRGLWNLETLDLLGNGLNTIYPDCFQNVATLKYLNLGSNHLSNLDKDIFKNLRHITTLDLSHNSIAALPSFVFSDLKSLTNLYLGNNALTNFNHALVGLTNLNFLDVSYNRIRSVNSIDFSGVPKVLRILVNRNAISSMSIEHLHKENIEVVEESPTIVLCVSNGIVTSLHTLMKQDSPLSNQCRVVEITSSEFHGKAVREVSLKGMGISSFAKNWYRLQDVYVTKLDLSNNSIGQMTREILNDLPKSVTWVTLNGNSIGHLRQGVIANNYLTTLDLTYNQISDFEDNALRKTRLVEISLRDNRLTNTRFAAALPPTLLYLDAAGNYINEISAGSFSSLNNLIHLNLKANQISNIVTESLRGLSAVEELWLSSNYLQEIQYDSFQELKALKRLHLDFNSLKNLDKRIFHGLANLSYINLENNKLEKVTNDSFPDLPDALQILNLKSNQITILGTGSFNGVPKDELLLADNKITELKNGIFNLPDLVVLDLKHNQLSKLNGDTFKSMTNLERLYLAENDITTIGKDVAKYFKKIYILDISKTAITTLKNGELSDLAKLPYQKFEATILLEETPIDYISGGLFDDNLGASR